MTYRVLAWRFTSTQTIILNEEKLCRTYIYTKRSFVTWILYLVIFINTGIRYNNDIVKLVITVLNRLSCFMYQLSLATLSEINPISEVPLHQDAIYLCVKSDANVLSVIELQITLKTFIYIITIFGTSVPLFMLV